MRILLVEDDRKAARSFAPQRAFLRTTRLVIAVASAVVVTAVVVVGLALTRSALRPVDALIRGACRIGRGPLTERLADPGTEDEIGRLAGTLNELLDRLAQAVEAERRFTTGAAHELRSPLSRLRVALEIALRRPRTSVEYQNVLRAALDEAEGLRRLGEASATGAEELMSLVN
jgi:two-component system OmpR family sensor kinase